MIDAEPGDLLVARLWRWDSEQLRADAEKDQAVRRAEGEPDPDHSISVFGEYVTKDEPVEVTARRLCAHIQTVPRNARWVTFTTDRRLAAKGFMLRLSEPPAKHYDVVLGYDLVNADLDGLAAVLGEHERRRFPSCSL